MSEPEVRAILQVRYVVCHGKSRQEGGLDLRTSPKKACSARGGTKRDFTYGSTDEIGYKAAEDRRICFWLFERHG